MNSSLGLGALCVALALILSACGNASSPAAEAQAQVTAPPPPADAVLARLYDQTCRACHASSRTGAPMAGDTAAWAPRMAQGMDVLIDHTINGFNGMPPLGACMDCSEDEFAALIRYMAGE